ncbi:S8 family peptidase [Streptomyces sp. NPDC005374]|uniref:S8 family peptidase n=1 Tax=Streptomyces sp. NPDC005374 TaxID=3364713 RepID=UPI00368EC964
MPQQHPGRRRSVGRRAALLLAPALAGGMILAYSPLSQAAQAGSARQAGTYSAGIYLVQIAGDPVATYSKTAPAPGKRLNTGTEAVRDYVGHLKRQREKVLDEVPGVRPLYSYQYVLNGFAAKLTARQANTLARTEGVVSLSRNERRQVTATAETDTNATADIHATAADSSGGTSSNKAASGTLPVPDTAKFLGLKNPGGLYSKVPGGQANAGRGLIIGVLDTGIDTNNPSLAALPEPLSDADAIAKKWKGSCDRGEDSAHRVTCNNKVIGAQYFDKGETDPTDTDWASPMDSSSHGTHTATTAAGNYDVPATVPDTAISGRISGLAPAARIAAYKVCWHDGCWAVDIAAAYDKAVADGVDVINYSIGGGSDSRTDIPEYTAMFNAAKAGVFVSTSAGNSGRGTVENNVPWVTTVAASSHDLGYRTKVTLGNGVSYSGVGVNATAVPSAPLVDGANAARDGVDATSAGRCTADSLDPAKVTGAIVVCVRGDNDRVAKSDAVKAAGGVGMVLYYTSEADDTIADAHTIPTAYLNPADGQAVKAYAGTTGATAAIGAAKAVHQRAPQVAGFSSGGPDLTSGGDQLKPDITAPGMDIVAGTTPGGEDGTFKGEQGIMSGTSMAAPHVAGLGLLLRQLHPDWSPMEIKSALMTTATTKDNEGKPIARTNVDGPATPLDYGSGHVVPNTADDPGLVYDSHSADWTSYMCALGDEPVTGDGSDACATARKTDASDLNTPNISVGDLTGKQTVTRTVTNVTATTGVYTAELQTPDGYEAEVTPKLLVVPAGGSATYKVTFTRTDAAYGDWAYGSVTLSDKDDHRVRSTVALRAVQLTAPATATATSEDATGSVTVTPQAGWKGTFTTKVNGLYAGTTQTGTLTGTDPDFGPPPAQLAPSTIKTEITVPEGTTLARVALRSADHLAGSDVDLWVYDKDGNLLSNPDDGNDEQVDLTPGTYEVYVNQYAMPEGVTSQTYTLHTWLVGPDTRPDHTATATPAEQQVAAGDTVETTVSWRDLTPGSEYLGVVEYGDGTGTVGTTVLTVTP